MLQISREIEKEVNSILVKIKKIKKPLPPLEIIPGSEETFAVIIKIGDEIKYDLRLDPDCQAENREEIQLKSIVLKAIIKAYLERLPGPLQEFKSIRTILRVRDTHVILS